jgi:hypothetical protein
MFSETASPTCFSGGCGICSGCSGGTVGYYIHPAPAVKEDTVYVKTNWEKYREMLKASEQYRMGMDEEGTIRFVQQTLTEVKRLYDDDVKPLQSELFAMRYMGVPLEGDFRLANGYRFCSDNFNNMDNLSTEEYNGYLALFPKFKEEMDNLMKGYNYEYPEKPGTIPKFYERKGGRYTLIEETGGQMCDDPECTMIGHCVMDTGEALREQESCEYSDYYASEYSDYYSTLPIYTRNKDHELCAICVSK